MFTKGTDNFFVGIIMKASNILKAILVITTTLVCTAVDCVPLEEDWAALFFTNQSSKDIYVIMELHPSVDKDSYYVDDPLEMFNTFRVEPSRTRSISSWTMERIASGYLKDDRIPVVICDVETLDTLSTYSLLPSELYDLSGQLYYPATEQMKQILDIEER